jgi:hypothetical protein
MLIPDVSYSFLCYAGGVSVFVPEFFVKKLLGIFSVFILI